MADWMNAVKRRAQVQILANRKLLGKFNILYNFHIWVSILKKNPKGFVMLAATFFLHSVSIFSGLK